MNFPLSLPPSLWPIKTLNRTIMEIELNFLQSYNTLKTDTIKQPSKRQRVYGPSKPSWERERERERENKRTQLASKKFAVFTFKWNGNFLFLFSIIFIFFRSILIWKYSYLNFSLSPSLPSGALLGRFFWAFVILVSTDSLFIFLCLFVCSSFLFLFLPHLCFTICELLRDYFLLFIVCLAMFERIRMPKEQQIFAASSCSVTKTKRVKRKMFQKLENPPNKLL